MQASDITVIVGAGQAGAELAAALRQQKYPGRIILVGDEPQLPYRRPPLSKTYLSGQASADSLLIRNEAAYAKLGVECRIGARVAHIDRAAKILLFEDGSSQAYDKLALTTGGRPRTLSIAGAHFPNVHYVRTIADVDRLRPGMTPGRRLAIIGGGYIGLEIAAVAVKQGVRVTLLEALPRVLARVATPELSAFYERLHRARGVELRTGAAVERLDGAAQADSVILKDGTAVPADMVVVGIGLLPNQELAAASGLAVDNGIVVDAYARTSDPDIVAAGDCAHHHNEFLGRSLRLESVPGAQEQARTAALTLCGAAQAHAAVPWFWSDQYELKLQMVGIADGHDRQVVRGDLAGDSFAVFYFKGGEVISATFVNRPLDFSLAKRLVAGRMSVPAEQLADQAIPLNAHVAAGA
jgi:3-phenylpropionate/trans-cinnamate dioxygenase ferredoxin reductase subunit